MLSTNQAVILLLYLFFLIALIIINSIVVTLSFLPLHSGNAAGERPGD